jgi:Mrp family chromosome partitioning ATPase
VMTHLLAECAHAGIAVIVVQDRRVDRDWVALGATAVLGSDFEPGDLVELLGRAAREVRVTSSLAELIELPSTIAPAPLVAVTGAPGSGRSTVSIAIAQGLAADPARDVVLADLCLSADQALLHGTADVIPALPELVDAHRVGRPAPSAVRDLTWSVEGRRYRLLLGLRRHRDWAAIQPRAVAAAITSLTTSFGVAVADVDADLEGQRDTGSIEVEERNHLARTAIGEATVVVVVGRASMHGIAGLVRSIGDLVAFGVPVERLLPVLNGSPRSPRRRAEMVRAISELAQPMVGRADVLAPPVHIPWRPGVERALRDGVALPSALASPVGAAVGSALDRIGGRDARHGHGGDLVVPGSLGSSMDDTWEESA